MKEFLSFFIRAARIGGMFGVNRVEEFNLFITGYIFAKDDGRADISEFMTGFQEHVRRRFDVKDHDWPKVIRLHSGSDRNSMEQLNDVINAFLEKKGIALPENTPIFNK